MSCLSDSLLLLFLCVGICIWVNDLSSRLHIPFVRKRPSLVQSAWAPDQSTGVDRQAGLTIKDLGWERPRQFSEIGSEGSSVEFHNWVGLLFGFYIQVELLYGLPGWLKALCGQGVNSWALWSLLGELGLRLHSLAVRLLIRLCNCTSLQAGLCNCLWSSEVPLVVQLPSHVQLFVTPWSAACQASLSLTISQSLPKFMFIALVMPSSHLMLWHPLLLLPSIFPSIRHLPNEFSVCIRWPKYGSFSFSISIFSEHSGLIPLRLTGLISLLSKGRSGALSSTTVRRHQFFDILPSFQSSFHNCTWPLGRP